MALSERGKVSAEHRDAQLSDLDPVTLRQPSPLMVDMSSETHSGGTEGRSAIGALLKLLSAGSRSRDDTENENPDSVHAEPSGGRQNRKGGSGSKPLMRPLIAICNDLYAPALRPLRAVAKVVHFKKPSVRPPFF